MGVAYGRVLEQGRIYLLAMYVLRWQLENVYNFGMIGGVGIYL